jgi:hypothetical protein
VGHMARGGGGGKNLAKGVNGTKVTVGVPSASATLLRFVIK